MLYHTITGKATPGREEEAVRWLKKIAQYNEQNYTRTVEVLHPVDGRDNVYIFAVKVDSFAVWEADNKRWATDAQGAAILKEGEGIFGDFVNHLFEIL